MTLFESSDHKRHMFSRYLYLDSNFSAEHVFHEWSRLVTFCNELLYIISFGLYKVSVILFGAT
jgi:hypothetical protein